MQQFAYINVSFEDYRKTWNHLLPQDAKKESVAFWFANFNSFDNNINLDVCDTKLIQPLDYNSQNYDYNDLSDDVRISVIKKAHSSNTSVIEMHSHPFPSSSAAAFSYTDMCGLNETVSNLLWRLQKRPYTAIVVSPAGFDALL